MTQRRVERPRPAPEPPFSKGQVNRAGRVLVDLAATASRQGGDRAAERIGSEEIVLAFQAVSWWRTQHARPLTNVAANLRYHVDKEVGLVDDRMEVTQRLKRWTTKPKMQLTQMQDVGGVRAVLPSLHHVLAVSRRLRKTWTIIRVRDYIYEPKPSGYRALHLIVRRGGYPLEVQLRTILQDAWANQVEDDGRQIGVGLKFGAGAAEIHAYYVAISDAFALLDRGETLSKQIAVTLNARYAKIRESLPREDGSTP